MSANPDDSAGIAIVGMAGRFPGAADIEAFWSLLREGRNGIRLFTREELLAAGVSAEVADSADYVPAKGWVADSDCFDADFFGISPGEAAFMDPQHRIFLECCWHALEDAGYDPGTYEGWIGVYAGGAEQSHNAALVARYLDPAAAAKHAPVFFGNSPDFLSTRVSYKLDLRGPSLTVQTACSTSLVAVHLACQALLAFEADMALAGGVSIGTPDIEGYLFAHGSVESPDGQCRPFDADAAGTLPSNGAGVVLLKRLVDAVADGDSIHAVIRGTAINNDGARKVGFTAPSIEGQSEVVSLARKIAGIEAAEIGYVEAHGTGTIMGDPIEIAALAKAFGPDIGAVNGVAIGSLKANVGHMKAAAGVAGLIKATLALKNREIPPTPNFRAANPALRLESTPFRVSDTLRPWPAPRQGLRTAAVSSFGIGGTNAHALVQEAPPRGAETLSRSVVILPVSARKAAVLDRASLRLVGALGKLDGEGALADAAFTLQVGRQHFDRRRAVVASTPAAAIEALEGRSSSHTGRVGAAARPICFLFPGQGSEFPGMGRDLYQAEPVFRDAVDLCAREVSRLTGVDIRTIIFADDDKRLTETEWAQPALFTIHWALATLAMSWGLKPERVVGHSVGEITAACVAGVMSVEAAVSIAVRRGQLMAASPVGAMLVVAAAPADIADLHPDACVAAINSPRQCVLSGTPEAIAHMERRLTDQGIQTRRLGTNRAFHSHLQDGPSKAMAGVAAGVALSPPRRTFISTVHGRALADAEAIDPDYWRMQARQPVRFLDALDTVLAQGPQVLLEIGPGNALSSFARRHPRRTPETDIIALMPLPSAGKAGGQETYEALAEAYVQGCEIDWQAFNRPKPARRISLPGYPFERVRFTLDDINDDQRLLTTDAARPTLPNDSGAGSEILYIPAWERCPSALPVADIGRTWLLAGADVASDLGDPGGNFTIISPGSSGGISEGQFLEALALGTPRRIVHLLCLRSAGMQRQAGYETLTAMGAALQRAAVTDAVNLVCAAANLFAVESLDIPDPEVALLLGPCRVIGQEMPNIAARVIDAKPDCSIDRLLGECLGDGPRTVALRGRHRLAQQFRPMPIVPSAPAFIGGGHYLVTGGLGRLGLAVGRELAERYNVRLTMLGRSVVPPRTLWSDWLAENGQSDTVSLKILGIKAIEAAGGSVRAIACDILDRDALMAAIEEAETHFGPLTGVIHGAAQTAAFTPLATTTAEDTQRMLAAKIDGLQCLEAALGRRSIKTRILMSSLASVLGGLRFSAYSAANAWLDAYAEQSGRWTAFSWDGWKDAIASDATAASSRYAISTGQGVDAMETVLAAGMTGHVVVCGGDFVTRLEGWSGGLQAAESPGVAASHSEGGDTADAIAKVFAEVLGYDRIAADDDFFERGGDSLQAIQVISRLRQRLGLPVTPALFFANTAPVLLAAAMASLPIDDAPVSCMRSPAREDATRSVELMSGDEVQRMLETLLAEGSRA